MADAGHQHRAAGPARVRAHWPVDGVDGVDHWSFRDGLVERYRADYGDNGLLRRLGIVRPPGSRGEKAMVRLQRLGARLRRKP